MSFSQLVSELGPTPEKLKSKKKKRLSDFGPPLRIPGHAPGWGLDIFHEGLGFYGRG